MSIHEDYASGTPYSANYVIAVIDGQEEAQRAAGALHAAGFPDAAVGLSPEVKACLTPLVKSPAMEGSLGEPPTEAEKMFTEEGLDHEKYAKERLQCHVVLRITTAGHEQVEQARRVLAAHHAHTIMRVGRWTRENLSDRLDG
jgi:hypothetical protein